MNRNIAYAVVFAVCYCLCFSAIFIAVELNQPEPHQVEVTFRWSTLQANTTQGGTVAVNCTVFNTDNSSSINEGFSTYADAFNGAEPPWDISSQSKVCNVTFIPWVLDSLGPQENRTSTLYISFAGDAHVGNYTFPLQGFNNTLQVTVMPKRGS
jgi:hypothetical protein